MSQVNIPDPQLVELEALDEAFHSWYQQEMCEENDEIRDDANSYLESWQNCAPSEPLTYTTADMEEAWGPDIEEGWEVANLAMSKDLQAEIEAKRRIIQRINQNS